MIKFIINILVCDKFWSMHNLSCITKSYCLIASYLVNLKLYAALKNTANPLYIKAYSILPYNYIKS